MTDEVLTPKQIYRKQYYLDNKEKAKKQIRARYDSKKEELLQYQKEYRANNRDLINKKVNDKSNKRFEKAVELLGGKCFTCLGMFPKCVYDFHHINPNEKEFTISENRGVSEKRYFKEVLKCKLLCANCHRLEHYYYKEVDEQ